MVSITHLLNRSPTIKRHANTSDGQGGFTRSLPTVSTTKGRRHAASGSDRFVAGKEEAVVTHIWYFDFGVDIKDGDIIVDGGVSYETLAVLPPSQDDFLKVKTREFQAGGN